jgi:hypothetical protein
MVWKLTRGEPEQGVREGEKSTDDLLYTAKRERRFLWKLDICLITWAWCAYLIKVCGLTSSTGTDEGTGAHDVSLAYRLVELQDCLCVWHEGGCEWSRESLQLWQLT